MTEPDPGERDQDRAETRRVREWQRLYEWVYDELDPDREPEVDFVGWHSSYTDQPYPAAEMADWREATIRRIRMLRPRRVLELGVGSGLLLTGLARDAEEYVGTDFSAPALERLAARVAADPGLAGRVRLEERSADDFAGLPERHFDTVILNSVVQYFPSAHYLSRVLDGALRALRPGGAVFVGDVRDLRLHRAFRTGVQIAQLEAADDSAVARALVDDAVAAERELLLHPGFFLAVPGAAAVDLRVKRARFRNEMSAHRYDAVLFAAGAPVRPAEAANVLDWDPAEGLAPIAQALAGGAPLRVTGIPNARVWHELAAQRLLDSPAPPAQLAQVLRHGGDAPAPDPERFCELGDELGFETVVTWTRVDAPETLDVTYLVPLPGQHFAATPPGPWPPESANDPLSRPHTMQTT